VRESMRPPRNPVESDAPLDDITTSKAAYIKHPIPAKPVHKAHDWCPNPAALDGLKSYRKEFTLKGDGKYGSAVL